MQFSDYFYYDETSPSCLRRKITKMSGRDFLICSYTAGDVAGTLCRTTRRWFVVLECKTYVVSRIIWAIANGDIDDEITIDHVNRDCADNRLSNLRAVPYSINNRNKSKSVNNKTGVTGVQLDRIVNKGRIYFYYAVTWCDAYSKTHRRRFSFKNYGQEDAFLLACEYRAKVIAELNAHGAGYTETHGQ